MMHYGEYIDISFAIGHKMFEQESGVCQYVEVVIITLQTKPNHHVDSNRDAKACYVSMHAYY